MNDPFENLIYRSGLYPLDFIQTFGEESPHWYVESWRKRELSLRHDMVCTLLANLEPSGEIRKRMRKQKLGSYFQGPHLKRRKHSESQPSTSSSSPQHFEFLSDSSSEDDGDSDPMSKEEKLYRILLLEGDPSASFTQNELARRWGCSIADSTWDLVDKKERKFIEVKITKDYREAAISFEEKSSVIPMNSALVWMDPSTSEIRWLKHKGGLRGEAKAASFLARRRLMLQWDNALETPMMEEADIQSKVFCNTWFNNHVSEWSDAIWALKDGRLPSNFNADSGPTIGKIKIEQLTKNLEDPRDRPDCEWVKWRGKILPDPFVKNFKTNLGLDNEIVDLFFRTIAEIPVSRDHEVLAAREAQLKWQSLGNEKSTYGLITDKEYGRVETMNLERAIGVKMKKTIYDASCSDTVQPDYSAPKRERYHPWFDQVVDKLNTYHGLSSLPFVELCNKENETLHKMAETSQRCVNSILSEFVKTHAAVFASKITNTYSRLGRAYAPPSYGRNAGRANTIVMPIYATMYNEEGNKERLVSGILIRGPNHARVPTDRINCTRL